MLVLSRRTHEKIVLPSINTTIEVVSLKGNTIRLGISAPPDVPIFREELFQADMKAIALEQIDAVADHLDQRNRRLQIGKVLQPGTLCTMSNHVGGSFYLSR